MKKHKVVQVGLGNRGKVHISGFIANSDRFEVVALCDLIEERLVEVAREYGITSIYTDVEKMVKETKPDVFSFATQPDARLSLVELAAGAGIKAVTFEKPMATSLREAKAITNLCRQHGIKAVVSHQQKYLTSMQYLKKTIDKGDIGEITDIHATTLCNLSGLGTHFMDYIIWSNGGHRAKWAVGHVHGRKQLFENHPAPSYVMGQVEFENGVRAIIECGYLAPANLQINKPWLDNRLTVYGSHGYVWAETDGRWGTFNHSTSQEMLSGQGEHWRSQELKRLQPLYLKDLADWLDDDSKVHPCNVDIAYHGYEILEAICLSAVENKRIDLPFEDPESVEDIIKRMKNELPEVTEEIS